MGICVEKVKELMMSHRWCASELARRMGVSRSEVTRLLKGNRQGGTKIVEGLKRAFPEVSLESLFSFPFAYPIVNSDERSISVKEQQDDHGYKPIKHPNASQLACTLNEERGLIKIRNGHNLTILKFPPGHVAVKHTNIDHR